MADETTGEPAQPPTGTIFNIMRFSVHDGPGIRTTVFLKGCPLQCAWCHNPEALSGSPELMLRPERCIACGDCMALCPRAAVSVRDGVYITQNDLCARCGTCADACAAGAREIVGRAMSVEEVMREVERDATFYRESGGGVTFSGGEPLMQHRFLLMLLRACEERNLHVAIDTSGYASPEVLYRVAELTHLFLYDLKSVNDDIHSRFTGVSGALVRGNLRRLASWGKRVVIRMPIIPGINDAEPDVEAAGKFIASLGNVVGINLLPYHAIGAEKYARLGMTYSLPDVSAPTGSYMHMIAENLLRFHPAVSIGG
ncbi:MAG TPA: glycyl-radical enzyme activating protein [Bacteroidota bacterium]|nr:glycyl-radical enzyme activating protein [Bacteroidota bacterium]